MYVHDEVPVNGAPRNLNSKISVLSSPGASRIGFLTSPGAGKILIRTSEHF